MEEVGRARYHSGNGGSRHGPIPFGDVTIRRSCSGWGKSGVRDTIQGMGEVVMHRYHSEKLPTKSSGCLVLEVGRVHLLIPHYSTLNIFRSLQYASHHTCGGVTQVAEGSDFGSEGAVPT